MQGKLSLLTLLVVLLFTITISIGVITASSTSTFSNTVVSLRVSHVLVLGIHADHKSAVRAETTSLYMPPPKGPSSNPVHTGWEATRVKTRPYGKRVDESLRRKCREKEILISLELQIPS